MKEKRKGSLNNEKRKYREKSAKTKEPTEPKRDKMEILRNEINRSTM